MRNPTRLVPLALALALAASAALPAHADPGKGKKKKTHASITIVNRSKWSIHHLFLTPYDEKSWGPDQLGNNVIDPGSSFTLTDIECDVYDIRIVDEDKDECIVEDVDFCVEDEKWVITDKDLLKCQAHS